MSRRDYIAIAAALKDSDASRVTCRAIADVCAADNQRFDERRFLVACGFGQPTLVNHDETVWPHVPGSAVTCMVCAATL